MVWQRCERGPRAVLPPAGPEPFVLDVRRLRPAVDGNQPRIGGHRAQAAAMLVVGDRHSLGKWPRVRPALLDPVLIAAEPRHLAGIEPVEQLGIAAIPGERRRVAGIQAKAVTDRKAGAGA